MSIINAIGIRIDHNMPNLKITVFGAANTVLGEPLYQDGLALGQLLANAGFDVITGGYIGSMEAVSRGAAEAGAHVIGITCRDIEAWRGVKANPWVIEEQQFDTFFDQLGEYTPPNYRQWVSFAPDVARAVELLQTRLGK